MLQLVRLGKGHVHTDPHRRFRRGFPPLKHIQLHFPGVRHFAKALRPLPVADQNRLPGLQPQHLRVLGILPGQHDGIGSQFLAVRKKRTIRPFPLLQYSVAERAQSCKGFAEKLLTNPAVKVIIFRQVCESVGMVDKHV